MPVRVHGQPVRKAQVVNLLEGDEPTLVADVAALDVEVEDGDAPGQRVDVVEVLVVWRPLNQKRPLIYPLYLLVVKA